MNTMQQFNEMMKKDNQPRQIVAVFGGGVAGAEAAFQLSKRGIYSILFEQQVLPYGKIEEGLPKWHIKLRNQEEQKIDEKLSSPNVIFVPKTRFGRDISLKEVLEWGFSAVLLAVGAWHDRRLPVSGIDDYIGRGFHYQNSFVSWFNHKHEPEYSGPCCEIRDNAVVIGGGLASIDVAKILMLETTRAALQKRGIREDIFTLEREGIPAVLKRHGLSWKKLGLKGCTLYYRKRVEDMPLTPLPEKADSGRLEKIYQLRKRILNNFMQNYLFSIQECHTPVDKIIENDRLAGIVFQKTDSGGTGPLSGGKVVRVASPLVISSIGSVPEPAGEIPLEGEMLSVEDPASGRIRGYGNVFAVGNAVTGRGNIRESLTHSREITGEIIRNYLDPDEENFSDYVRQRENDTAEMVSHVADSLASTPKLSLEKVSEILKKIEMRQHQVGYSGNYEKWIQENRPIRLEELD